MKFHLIPCDFIHYRETYIYLFFYIPMAYLFYNQTFVPLDPLTYFILPTTPSSLATSSLSWRPTLKPYTPVTDTVLSYAAADNMVA